MKDIRRSLRHQVIIRSFEENIEKVPIEELEELIKKYNLDLNVKY